MASGKRVTHLGDAPVDSVRRYACFDDVSPQLGEDVGGPQRPVRLGLGEPEQGVAEVGRVELRLGEQVLRPTAGERGEGGFVELADVDDAALGEDVGEHVEEVQLAGVEVCAPLEPVEGTAGRFAVEAGEGPEVEAEAVVFGGDELDVLVRTEPEVDEGILGSCSRSSDSR
jgi:hypothetical protein